MTTDGWVALAIVAAVFAALAFSRIAPYLILFGGMAAMLLSGILDAEQALAGFSNSGVITVGVLFAVAAGMEQTGALPRIVHALLRRPKSVARAQAKLVIPVATASAFINNTPLVVMLTPVIKSWSRGSSIPASKLLIPLSYAAILGGMCTLIGTSTNLIVSGLMTDAGLGPLAFFAPTKVGVPCAIAGVGVMLLFGRWLLPDLAENAPTKTDPREYTVEMRVAKSGPLAGKTVEEAGLRHLPGLFLSRIHRGDRVLPIVAPDDLLQGDDQLIFVGVVESIVDLQRIPGLLPATKQVFKLGGSRANRSFAEAVVSRSSPLVGQTIREGGFRNRFGAVVLAVNRDGERIHARIGDVRLQPGDALLVEAPPTFLKNFRDSAAFYLVSELDAPPPALQEKALTAGLIMIAMIVIAAMGWVSMLEAALLAAAAMLLTRCCTSQIALRGVDWTLLMAIASSFALGRGLTESGAASAVAGALLSLASDQPHLALALIYLLTATLTEFVTNNAAAVIVFPLALQTAERLDVSAMPFIIALMIGASASFITPIGYQTNLLVYGAGGYRFRDFMKIGIPMALVITVMTITLTPLAWPF